MELLRVANSTVPAGNQITNTAAKTNFADSWSLPQNIDNTFNFGRVFKFKGFGYLSTKATGPGTLVLSLNLGTTVLCSTAAIALPAAAANIGFMLDAVAVMAQSGSSSGTTGKMQSSGFCIFDNVGAALTAAMINTGTLLSSQVTANTQGGNALQLAAQFSLADVGNIITLSQFLISEIP